MADDAMDWHPTTPPAPHNPYSHPRYVPGGWPTSPPIDRITSGVFSRKREPGLIKRAAKRVCTGVWRVGSLAVALPVKPVYLVVRGLRERRRARSETRALARNSAQNRRGHPALQAQVVAAVQHLHSRQPTSSPQQILTPPATPPTRYNDIVLNAFRSGNAESIRSPAATSVTNTETTLLTPASSRSLQRDFTSRGLGSGVKRAREEEYDTSDSLHYSTLEDYLDATARLQQPTPQPETPPTLKRMRGLNRFDLHYKRSPTALAERGGVPVVRVRPIGSKIEGSNNNASLFGGWEHEIPIDATPPLSPDHSLQLQSELQSQTSEHTDAEPKIFTSQKGKGANEPTQTEQSYDERWASSLPLSIFAPKDYDPDDSTTSQEPIKTKNAVAVPDETLVPLDSDKVFYGGKRTALPPRIKPRLVSSRESRQVQQQTTPAGSDLPTNKIRDTASSQSSGIAAITNIKNDTGAQEGVAGNVPIVTELTAYTSIKSGVNKPILANESVATPGTPLKVVAEKVAPAEVKTPATKPRPDEFETPANKLAKLKIQDGEENDTPKATPHSGTKTTRVTRYREALEKAQKAKLEQYEIMPITNEWDKKVRAAVRNGIPDYLGPHDLARVVPQYASRGQDNWLNDETINKYLELVAAHGRKNDRPDQVCSHHTFNNFFYNNLKSKGATSVARWSKRAKIGGKNLLYVEKVFVPVNSGAHWTLAVVEPTQKRITHYNSMRGPSLGMRVCEDLRGWVSFELGKDFKDEEWTLTAVGESPQQTNSDDCGVFTITSARQIMLGYTPMSYGDAQIPTQRIRIVAELINRGLLKSTVDV